MQATIQTLSTYVGGATAIIGVHETCPYPFTHDKYAWASNMNLIEFQFISLWKGCHQLPKRGRLKALVWFWWIDETLSANLVYLSDHKIGSTIPSGEAMAKIMTMVMAWWWSKGSNLEKKKEKNKRLKAKVQIVGAILFRWSRHLASVITFRLHSHTIKRGETRIEMRLSKCH